MRSERALVLTLDAADEGLVRRWAGDGTLPTFARLLRDGSWAQVANPIGLAAGAVWPGFYAAVSPGVHGLYDALQRFDPETYRELIITPEQVTRGPFWSTVAKAGKRVVLLDCPYNYVDETCGAVQVLDWGTHDRTYLAAPVFRPTDLGEALLHEFGTDPFGYQCQTPCQEVPPKGREGFEAFRDALLDRCRRRRRLISRLVERGGWDLMLASFSEAHCIGHTCWHIHDPQTEADRELAETIGDPVREVYAAIDRAVAEILEVVPSGTAVFVYLSHGMGLGYSASNLLDAILARLEGGERAVGRSWPVRAGRALWRRAPGAVRRALMPLRRGVWQEHYERSLRRSERRFFEVVNNDAAGGVRINLEGREAQGKVKAGEYEAVLEELARDLGQVENVDSGRPLARRVLFAQREFPGPEAHRLPDLVLEWDRRAPIRSVRSPKIGLLPHVHTSIRTGDHEPDGLFVAMGGSGGRLAEPVALEDLAPTLAAAVGCALPDVGGRPREAFLTDRSRGEGRRFEERVPPQ